MKRASLGLVVSLTTLVSGCNLFAAAPQDRPGALGDQGQGAARIAADDFDYESYEQRALDLNRDGLPDAYQYVQPVDGNPVVFRKEVDVNFDGRIDLIRTFSADEELLVERLDHDFDGRIDVVNYFEQGAIVRKEYDTNYDATIDMWRYYDQGMVSRKEADLNYDGRVDYWEYFEQGQLDRIGIDRDADGEVDDWETSSAG